MEQWVQWMWNPYLLLAFGGVGLYLSLCLGWIQLNIPLWWRATVLGQGEKSQRIALFASLATTIGTGSIAGVATALWYGGEGAIFWMWVSGILGMMLSCCEKMLTVAYRVPCDKGTVGGPMYYLQVKSPFLAKLFALGCIFASLMGGNMVQSASIAQGLHHLGGIPPMVTVLLLWVILAKTGHMVGRISSILVPMMAVLYVGSALYCLYAERGAVPQALGTIFAKAWGQQPLLGGGIGYGVMESVRYGMARGIFSNEGGLGASAMAHGNVQVDCAARQGMWGILEVFFATMIVCTLTALVLITSGVLTQQGIPLGVPMTQMAFAHTMGQRGTVIVTLSLVLFAFTSILGWGCYGVMAVTYLGGGTWGKRVYYLVATMALWMGAVGDTGTIWHWVDGSMGLMAIPNLIGLVLLAPQSMKLWEEGKKILLSPKRKENPINQPSPRSLRKQEEVQGKRSWYRE